MADANSIMLPNGQEALTRRAVLAGLTISLPQIAQAIPRPFAHGTTTQPPTHPVLALPFVRDTTEREQAAGAAPRSFWSVTPTGHYGTDCTTGAHYGALALDYMSTTRTPQILQWAVIDMLSMGRRPSGVEVGFLSSFGRTASMAHARSFLEGDAA